MTYRFSNFNSISYTNDRHELRVTGTKCPLPDTISGTSKIFISGAEYHYCLPYHLKVSKLLNIPCFSVPASSVSASPVSASLVSLRPTMHSSAQSALIKMKNGARNAQITTAKITTTTFCKVSTCWLLDQ